MKKLTLVIALSYTCSAMFAQKNMTEKEAIHKDHIDFKKEYLFFKIDGLVEIDGHTFKNDTVKCPIIFKADLSGSYIVDTCKKVFYENRVCGIKNCKIIHLENVRSSVPNYYDNIQYYNGMRGL